MEKISTVFDFEGLSLRHLWKPGVELIQEVREPHPGWSPLAGTLPLVCWCGLYVGKFSNSNHSFEAPFFFNVYMLIYFGCQIFFAHRLLSS